MSDQNASKPKKLTGKDLSAGQAVVGPSDQAPGNGNKKIRKRQNGGGGSAGPGVNVQRNFKVNKPNETPQRQLKLHEKPNVQVFSKPQKPKFHAQPKPEFRAQPKPQIQEQRLPQQPKPQQLPGKKLSCGHQGEPACGK